jgi:hypothetical protein
MRLTQFKNPYFKYREIVCADVFCGSGKNYVQGEIVAGSPLRIMNAYRRANNTNVNFKFWFSDILPEACATLKKLLPVQNNVHIYTMAAADALNRLGKYLKDHPLTLLFLVLDPNGPKDFPKHEAIDLLSEFSKRVDIVPYISATTINRCIGARDKGGITFKGWLGSIENFDEGFVSTLTKHGRMGWIREPIKSDPQHWTILPTYGHMFPKSDWSKQGLVSINSDRGQKAIEFYNGKTGESNERI